MLDPCLHATHMIDLDIFAVPMPFSGITGIRQQNAIWSWTQMETSGWIFLLGPDVSSDDLEILPETAIIGPPIETDEFGTPLISSVFRSMQEEHAGSLVAYVNSDVILAGLDGAMQICDETFDEFLVIGRRWDLDITNFIDFGSGSWTRELYAKAIREGDLHSVGAIDWFGFTSGIYPNVPPFAIGRSAWDNWLVLDALKRGIPVVDASRVTLTVHQNKNATTGKPISRERQIQRDRNRAYYDRDRGSYSGSSKEATWLLTFDGLERKK